jgi:membrane-associated protein
MGIDIVIIGLIYKYPHQAHWIIFFALILAGFNIPISEDLMLVTSGVLASAFVPENTFKLWAAVFIGAYISDAIAYWTGRLLGPKLLTMKFFSKFLKQERIDKMHAFYEKWGFLAFLVGRFVPFGVRNCLFISAGMGHMSFPKFLLMSGFASLISTTTAFYIAYTFGKHYEVLLDYLKTFDVAIIIVISASVLAVIGFIWYKKRSNAKKKINRQIVNTDHSSSH